MFVCVSLVKNFGVEWFEAMLTTVSFFVGEYILLFDSTRLTALLCQIDTSTGKKCLCFL